MRLQTAYAFFKPTVSKLLIVCLFLTLFVIVSNILVYVNLYAYSILEFRNNRNLHYEIQGAEMPSYEADKFEEAITNLEPATYNIKLVYYILSPIATDEYIGYFQAQLVPRVMPPVSVIQILNLAYWYVLASLIVWGVKRITNSSRHKLLVSLAH